MLQHTKHQLNGIASECLTTPCVLFFSSRTPTAEQLSKTNFDKDNQLGLVTNLKIAGSCWGGVVTESRTRGFVQCKVLASSIVFLQNRLRSWFFSGIANE